MITNLRLLQTFAETSTNYISIRRLINAEFEEKINYFIYLFVKAKETVNSKKAEHHSVELIGYQT